jgi:hypothetical protein
MGQGETLARPRAAEWARTAVRRAGYLLATTPGGASVWTALHAVDPTGAVVLVVPATDPLVAAVGKAAPDPDCWPGPGLIAMVEAREESPLPLPCPARSGPGPAWRAGCGCCPRTRPGPARWRSPCAARPTSYSTSGPATPP